MAKKPYKAKFAKAYFCPPRGEEAVITGFIDRCAKTLDIAIYSLTHDAIAEALLRAHSRKVKIRILADRNQAASASADIKRLGEAGIAVYIDKTYNTFHHKFAVGDRNAVITGSFNWTKNAATRNAENFVIIRIKGLVEQYETEFNRLWAEAQTPAK